jgi:cysteinyl-tRNA synthetase
MMAGHTLTLYNTLNKAKETFTPIDARHVRLYVCGPTVYDRAHIGNARPIIVFDVLFRLLRHLYGEEAVTYVRNITDVDDKINARAKERGISIRELTEGTTCIFHEDVAALKCLAPSHEPRATDHIPEMVMIIGRLIARGAAYEAEGQVLFSVHAMDTLPNIPKYGSLARRTLDDMLAGARVDVAPYKRDPMDFVLWKPSTDDLPGWDSPWGRGRPGWHIECSAMAWKHLIEAFDTRITCEPAQKNTFDIHGGGIDLVFPHHENEIAQSCCAFDSPQMANIWMHNGFLQVEGQKMSKSLGNFITIGDLLNTDMFGGRKWDGAVLRLAMLKTHYRQPIDFTVKALEEAEKTLQGWANYYGDDIEPQLAPVALDALGDDLNTPRLVSELHRLETSGNPAALAATLKALGFEKLPAVMPEKVIDEALRADVKQLIADRLAARAAKNWAESDRIRDELKSKGIALKDNKDGTTTWE